MKILFEISGFFVFYLFFAFQAFANGDGSHAPGEEHNDVATVDPLLIIIPVVVVLGVIIVWKVMLSKKHVPPTQVPQAQTETPKVESQPSQPENIEPKK